MRSRYADYFNHDDDADRYDRDVTREEHPIRTGYRATVSWVGSRVRPGASVLDLGSGTGNTIRSIPADCSVTAVDISMNMTKLAQAKLKDRSVDFVVEDILAFVDRTRIDRYDFIISTYAFHHLMPEERGHLFAMIREKCGHDATVVVGDLMYKDSADRDRIIDKYRATYPGLAADFEDEYFWNIAETSEMLTSLECRVQWRRFSDLSWGAEISSM